MHSTLELYDLLNAQLATIDELIDAATKRAEAYIKTLPYPDATTIHMVQNSNGDSALAPLHTTRSEILCAMAELKIMDLKVRCM